MEKVIRLLACLRAYPIPGAGILAIEGALPIPSEGPKPDILAGFVVVLVPVVASAALGGSDMDPARGPIEAIGVGRHPGAIRARPRFSLIDHGSHGPASRRLSCRPAVPTVPSNGPELRCQMTRDRFRDCTVSPTES